MSKRQYATGSQNVFKALGVPNAEEHLVLEGGLVADGQHAADAEREFGVHHSSSTSESVGTRNLGAYHNE